MSGLKICANCKWHAFIDKAEDSVCENEESFAFSDWTDDEYGCEDFEEREDERSITTDD